MKTKHKPVVLLIILLLIDRIVTTLFWEYETNPLLVDIGILGMWLVPVITIPVFVYLYYWLYDTEFQGVVSKLCKGLCALYSVVVVSNLVVIFA